MSEPASKLKELKRRLEEAETVEDLEQALGMLRLIEDALPSEEDEEVHKAVRYLRALLRFAIWTS